MNASELLLYFQAPRGLGLEAGTSEGLLRWDLICVCQTAGATVNGFAKTQCLHHRKDLSHEKGCYGVW